MPLDGSPNLASLLAAVQAAMIDNLYDRLAAGGFTGLSPASAGIFRFVRPGGSGIDELARLAHASRSAVEEQVTALIEGGYARMTPREDGDLVELTTRGRAATRVGLAALADIEREWERLLGPESYSAFVAALARLNLAVV